ncbi:threonine synthase [Sphingomonas jaspsi]|uniref:threonine synthase n=1 Tax=Sphingomonas jaspsi TaxID=392409 RepID=UPI0004ACC59B|nr:threonine synthase [Sphingomonas jaspsi]
MKFVSTGGNAKSDSISEVLLRGAASDGGLYLPDHLPAPDWTELGADGSLADFAGQFLEPFFAGDPLAKALPDICAAAFDAPVPLVTPDPGRPQLQAVELFHGPTGAFKDFGARFLMGCFDRLGDAGHPLTVLAATSGDTGGAVGCAAEGMAAVRAIILFPKGRVSPFQERQLTCWRDPVQALEVEGDFDDCQRLVKAAFADAQLTARHRLTSANSINLGRLLPQATYLAHAAARTFSRFGAKPGFVIPTGNLGHGFAAVLARSMGAPIGPIRLSTNANRTLKDWSASGRYASRPSVATLANAMDVGAPSNFERLAALPNQLHDLTVELVDDAAIKARIRSDFATSGYVWCPHSATAAEAFARLPQDAQAERPWILAATAHPYKFLETVEPLIGRTIDPPPALAAIFDRPTAKRTIANDVPSLADALGSATVAAP